LVISFSRALIPFYRKCDLSRSPDGRQFLLFFSFSSSGYKQNMPRSSETGTFAATFRVALMQYFLYNHTDIRQKLRIRGEIAA